MRPGNAGGAQTIVSAFLASFVCNSVGRRASPPIEPVGSSRGVPADSRILSPQGPKAPLAPWRGFAFLGMQGISREACDVTREPLARSHTPTRSPRDRCRPLVVGYYRRAPRICYGNILHRGWCTPTHVPAAVSRSFSGSRCGTSRAVDPSGRECDGSSDGWRRGQGCWGVDPDATFFALLGWPPSLANAPVSIDRFRPEADSAPGTHRTTERAVKSH